jgi:photosystem II stability/assembly factor-like uncharacterized protein
VGKEGTILKTSDGGNTWQTQISGTYLDLNSVFFIDSRTGWAVGGDFWNNVVLKTTDGGSNWQTQQIGSRGPFFSVQFLDARNGWLGGESTLKTTDGGTTWQSPTSEFSNYFTSLFFVDSLTGYSAPSSTLNNTTDGGKTWNRQTMDLGTSLRSLYFTDAKNGWAVGDHGTILHTSTGGGEPLDFPQGAYDISSVRVFPNPADDFVEFWYEPGIKTITVTDALGRVLTPGPESWIEEREAILDISAFAPGLYYIKIEGYNSKEVKRLVKK